MIKTRFGIWPFLAVAALCFAACRKKVDVASPQPILSVPDKAEKVTVEAEVKASSGPVELSLLLHKTKIKTGDSLWGQIRIRNIGDKRITVSDPVFFDPRGLRKQSSSSYGIYLEAIGPDDKPMKVQFFTPAESAYDVEYRPSGLLEVDGPKEQAMLDDWKKQGLNNQEIGTKLIDFNTKKRLAVGIPPDRPVITLLPGQSAETKSAFFYSLRDKREKRPLPRPIGNFAQVDFLEFRSPGEYKVRAVYDHAPTSRGKNLARQLGLPTYPEEVHFRTSWIHVEIVP